MRSSAAMRGCFFFFFILFLLFQEAALDKESLKEHGVTHILTVNGKEPKFKDDFEYK